MRSPRIGRLCATELDDKDQALVAYGQALAECPAEERYAREIEQLAGDDAKRWDEVLNALAEAARDAQRPTRRPQRAAHLRRALVRRPRRSRHGTPRHGAARLPAGPGHRPRQRARDRGADDAAIERPRTGRRSWRSSSSEPRPQVRLPRGRDLRTEAAEVLETQLGESGRAKALYIEVLGHDPAHARASEALIRMAEKEGDFRLLAQLLERRAGTKRGIEKADALARVAEVYDDSLERSRRGDATLRGRARGRAEAPRGAQGARPHLQPHRPLPRAARQPRRPDGGGGEPAAEDQPPGPHREPRGRGVHRVREGHRDARGHPRHRAGQRRVARRARAPLSRPVAMGGRWSGCSSGTLSLVEDHDRKVELTLARADRARRPHGLAGARDAGLRGGARLVPDQPQALEALARLRETSGDAQAALAAVEALATHAAPGRRRPSCGRARRACSRGTETRTARSSATSWRSRRCPSDADILLALRRAYEERGEYAEVVALLERELDRRPTETSRGRACSRSSRAWRGPSSTTTPAPRSRPRRRMRSTRRTSTRSPSWATSRSRRGASSRPRKHYESLLGRTQLLDKADAIRVLSRFVEAFGKSLPSASRPRPALDLSAGLGCPALPRACSRRSTSCGSSRPRPIDVLEAIARVLFEFGDPKMAEAAYAELLEKGKDTLGGAERADALYRRGESARRAGDSPSAVTYLRDAADLDPTSPLALDALAKVYEKQSEVGGPRPGQAPAPRAGDPVGALRPAPGDRRPLVPEAGRPAPGAEDARLRARGATGRPQAPDQADAALLGGEGLDQAHRGRPQAGRVRRGPAPARQVPAHRRHRLVAPGGRARQRASRSTSGRSSSTRR